MKRLIAITLILSVIAIITVPAPVEAGGKDWLIGGLLFGGGLLLGSALNHNNRIVVGPVYRHYPPQPVYYPPPVVYYQPQQVWIPDHYELRWRTVCEIMYQRQHCYPAQITVFVPGHWEYR